MSIKKSTLEEKWYYRLLKIFFLILPILVLILLLLQFFSEKRKIICNFEQIDPSGFPVEYLIYLIFGLIIYYLILKLIWKGFVYIVFGGLEDDTKKDNKEETPIIKPKISKNEQIIPIIIALIVLAIIFLAQIGFIKLPKINFDDKKIPINNGGDQITCFKTSAEWGIACGSVSGGVGVGGLPIPATCDCPTDTIFSGTIDNITPGGPYKICVCK